MTARAVELYRDAAERGDIGEDADIARIMALYES